MAEKFRLSTEGTITVLLGFVFAGGAGASAMMPDQRWIGGFVMIASLLGLAAVALHHWWPSRRLLAVLSVLISLLGVLGIGWAIFRVKPEHVLTAEEQEAAARRGADEAIRANKPKAAEQVSMLQDCGPVGLPVQLQPHETINILPLNRAYIASNKYGLFGVTNNSESSSQFPDKKTSARLSKLFPSPLLAWRCEIKNLGASAIVAGGLDLAISFTDNHKPSNSYKHIFTVMTGPINAKDKMTFYMVNDCPEQVSLAIQDTIRVSVVGYERTVSVPLHRLGRNRIEQVAILFPSQEAGWVGVTRCPH